MQKVFFQDETLRTIEAIRKEHHFCNMAVTDAEITRECQELEDQELSEQNDAAKTDIYPKLLAIYILQNDLVSAKFLWKRIPDSFKLITPHLQMLWKIGQLLWSRDFPSAHLALNQEWPEEISKYILVLKEKLHERVQNMVSKAYSSIQAEEFAKLLGMNEEQALKVASQKEWQFDNSSGYIYPKPPDCGKHAETSTLVSSEQQLSRLTDYISYLEN